MKNILLLSDLSLASLWPVHAVVKEQAAQPVTIHVVHMLDMPTSISDLLFHKSNKPHALVSAEFTEALQLLKNKYSRQVEAIHFRFLYGNNHRILNNFIAANGIACTYVTASYSGKKLSNTSEGFRPLLKHCAVPVRHTPLQGEVKISYQSLSVLLEAEPSFVTAAKSAFSHS